MLRILVVEDEADKLRRVLQCLQAVPGCETTSIDTAHDATEAKRKMLGTSYDLLILDIALPERPEKPPARDGGLILLDEVLDRDIYQKPRHIVGLTAYPEILDASIPRFTADLWHVILYDLSSGTWTEQLQHKLRHILLADRNATGTAEYSTELCIVTALQDPELKAVLDLSWEWQKFEFPNDGTIYHRGRFSRKGETCEVVAASAARMGMPAAAVLSMKMIATFRPRYLAITGILAGVQGQCELGDIIVADPGWDYGSGKFQLKNGVPVFEAAPYQIALNSLVRGRLSLMAQDGTGLDEIRRSWQGITPKTVLRMHLGPVASGAAVLEDPAVLEVVRRQHRKIIGIEMETYGVLTAVEESTHPQPIAFSMKSVCDFANKDKNDDFRKYAAFTSAHALRLFVERFL